MRQAAFSCSDTLMYQDVFIATTTWNYTTPVYHHSLLPQTRLRFVLSSQTQISDSWRFDITHMYRATRCQRRNIGVVVLSSTQGTLVVLPSDSDNSCPWNQRSGATLKRLIQTISIWEGIHPLPTPR